MALRIEKAFGVKMDTLMRMQSAYDIAQTRKSAKRKSVCGAFTVHLTPTHEESPALSELVQSAGSQSGTSFA